ncbi:hypothetical protein D3C77_370400 [compost metagenome]
MPSNFNIDAIVRFNRTFPFHFDDACCFFPVVRSRNVRTIASVNGNSAAPGNIADDIVSRHRIAASGKSNKQIIDAFNDDPVRWPGSSHLGWSLNFLDFRGQLDLLCLFLLFAQLLRQLGHNLGCRDPPETDGGQHILNIVEGILLRSFKQFILRHKLRSIKACAFQFTLDSIAALLHILFPLLLLKPLLDFTAGMGGLGDLEPVLTRSIRMLRRQNLDNIACLKLMIQRNNPSIHLSPDRPIAHLGMNTIGKVKRYGALRQLYHFPRWGEDKYKVGEKVHL